jgi:hypothetical protein
MSCLSPATAQTRYRTFESALTEPNPGSFRGWNKTAVCAKSSALLR